ncbi:hypothetical protein L6R52_06260 [Myxococcota bacterium]|nr:hypothetical protein [Myxococcota bacterium]
MRAARHSGLALTVQQPWASALLAPVERYHSALDRVPVPKRVENRTWLPPRWVIGARIWIHAGKRFDADGELTCAIRGFVPAITNDPPLPRGALLGDARLVGVVRSGSPPLGLTLAELTAALDSPWWVGPCGWVLDDPRELLTPRYCRGAQGLWKPSAALHAECLRALDNPRSCRLHRDCDMADELCPDEGRAVHEPTEASR